MTLTRDGLPRKTPRPVKAEPAYEWLLKPQAD